jgi:Alpha and gamma adaptin binding protein p34
MSTPCVSILRIGPFPIDSEYALHLREAILKYLANGTTTPSSAAVEFNENVSLETVSDEDKQKYQFSITNRYFTADVRLAGIDHDELSNGTDTTATNEDGIILVFDAERSHPKYATSITSSFDAMESIHDQAVKSSQCGELLRLCVSIGNNRVVLYNGVTHELSDKEYEEEYSRRILWCLDHGYEYIEVPDLADISQGHDARDKDGFARIIEAISGTVWTSAVMVSKQQQTLQQSFAETRKDIRITATPASSQPDHNANGAYEPPNPLDFPPVAVDENDQERERKAHEALLADCISETAPGDTVAVDASNGNKAATNALHSEELQQERAMNALEASLNEARRIRELSKSGQLSDEDRRKRASDAAILIMQTMEQMGFNDDEDDDDIDDDNSLADEDIVDGK